MRVEAPRLWLVLALLLLAQVWVQLGLDIAGIDLGAIDILVLPAIFALAIYVALVGTLGVRIGFVSALVALYLWSLFGLPALYYETGIDFRLYGDVGTADQVRLTYQIWYISYTSTLYFAVIMMLASALRSSIAKIRLAWFGVACLGLGLILSRAGFGLDLWFWNFEYGASGTLGSLILIILALCRTRLSPLGAAATALAIVSISSALAWWYSSYFWNSGTGLKFEIWYELDFDLYFTPWAQKDVILIPVLCFLLALVRDQFSSRRYGPTWIIAFAGFAVALHAWDDVLGSLIWDMEKHLFNKDAFCAFSASLQSYGLPMAHVCVPEKLDQILLVGDPIPASTTYVWTLGAAGLLIGLSARHRWPAALTGLSVILAGLIILTVLEWERLGTELWSPDWTTWPLLNVAGFIMSMLISAPIGARLAQWRDGQSQDIAHAEPDSV